MPGFKRKKSSYGSSKKTRFSKDAARNYVLAHPNKYSYNKVSRAVDSKAFTVNVAGNLNISWVPNAGFGGTANDICFGVTQSGLIYNQANGTWTTGLTWANYASLATVFQEYRIMKFQIDLYYSANSVAETSAAASQGLPMVYAIQDREDDRQISGTSTMLQYASCKVMQCGNSSGNNNGRQSIVMNNPSCFVANDNDASLIGTIQASQLARSPWLSCGTNSSGSSAANIPHGYIKYYVDPLQYNSSANVVGVFTFVVKCIFQYKGID
jgi:hypothetical protein